MRALSLAGLSLALACLAITSRADEIQWRPVGKTATPAPANGQTGAPALIRTSFSSTDADPVLFRAKSEDAKPQPLPGDPVSIPVIDGQTPPPPPPGQKNEQKPDQKPEQMPLPKPLPSGNGPGSTPGVIITVPPGTVPPGAIFDGPIGGPIGGPALADGCCGDGCCSPDWSCCGSHKHGWLDGLCGCDGGCSLPRVYASGELLIWTLSRDHSPVLATATNLTPDQLVALGGTPGFTPGAIGSVGTIPVLGGDLNTPTLTGARFTVGFGDLIGQGWGLESTFFFLGTRTSKSSVSSDSTGMPGLYSPFFAPNGTPDALIVAFPTLLAGRIEVDHTSRMWGIEANVRKALICECNHKLDLLAGFRFIELDETLDIIRSNTCIQPGCEGEVSTISDHFGTRNRFYGGQVGFDYQYKLNSWLFGLTGKFAIGEVTESVVVNGSTFATPGANVTSAPTGLLAQASNIGRHGQTHFAFVPQVDLKIGYQLTDNLTVFVGYSALYMSDVVRPGQQVDLVVDKSGNLQRPAVTMRQSNFWAHGFSGGLEWKY